jgi:16S rRNA (guanine527-N7)-methyltransferase
VEDRAPETGDVFSGLGRTVEAMTGRPMAGEARARFSRYLDLLMLWNRSQRLTALGSADEIVRGLFEDSLLFLAVLPPRPLRMVDIGAGAGIPGVPLRIVDPAIRLTLVESRRKRVSFLRAVRRELRLDDVEVVEGRAEAVIEQATGYMGAFDVAVTRAVRPSTSLIAIALSYLKPQGYLITSGPPVHKVEEGIRLPGNARWEIRDFPGLGLRRAFLVVRREVERRQVL